LFALAFFKGNQTPVLVQGDYVMAFISGNKTQPPTENVRILLTSSLDARNPLGLITFRDTTLGKFTRIVHD